MEQKAFDRYQLFCNQNYGHVVQLLFEPLLTPTPRWRMQKRLTSGLNCDFPSSSVPAMKSFLPVPSFSNRMGNRIWSRSADALRRRSDRQAS